MAQTFVSKRVFMVGIFVAILVLGVVSAVIANGAVNQMGTQGVAEPTGATRYVIDGSFNVTQYGDLIKYAQNGTFAYHWKRIEVTQLTLSDMPSVQVYVGTPFESIENETQPIQLWRDVGITHGSIVEDTGVVLYDEGCLYIYYKAVIAFGTSSPYALYAVTGDYKIVVVK
jgi:hypothetical protein